MMPMLPPEIRQKLERADQAHLVKFWDDLDAPQQGSLLEQIKQIDFSLIASQLETAGSHGHATNWAELARRAEPPPAIRAGSPANPVSDDQARAAGERALQAGKVGFVLVAGGQGTRLGFPHPKGMYQLGPVSQRTLFQILIDLLRARSRRYGAAIPLYLMTSPATHDETIRFLDQHDRFGLPADDLKIFCQGTMPAVDAETGKILLAEKHQIATSPDGHGGMLAALRKSGCLDDIADRGIEQLFYGQVDNPLIQVCDPVLIGHHILSESELTTQAVKKSYPLERVGNVVSIDGRIQIIEYSDLPDEVAKMTDPDGSAYLWAGNIAVHVFETRFLQRVIDSPAALPFHLAFKQVPFIDDAGNHVEPEKPNAIKFERFIFDLLPLAETEIVVESEKAEAFAPVKNSAGEPTDTAEIAQRAMISLHTQWLRSAGAEIDPGIAVEISPFFAIDAEELKNRIEPGRRIKSPTFFE